METLKMQLVIDIEYAGDQVSEAEAKITLHYAAQHLAGNGLLSEGTGMEVDTWSHEVRRVA